MRKKDSISKSLPSSPTIQQSVRVPSSSQHTKKRHSAASNNSAIIREKPSNSDIQVAPISPRTGMYIHLKYSVLRKQAAKPMDLETIGTLIQTLLQQNSLLNQKVDALTQEVSTLRGQVYNASTYPGSMDSHRQLSSPSPPNITLHNHPLSTSNANNPLTSSNPNNMTISNPLSQSNPNNPLAMSGQSTNPLSTSNPNIFSPRANPLATSPTHLSPTFSPSPTVSSFPFSPHPLELRGVSSLAASTLSNPFTNQPLSLASFPH